MTFFATINTQYSSLMIKVNILAITKLKYVSGVNMDYCSGRAVLYFICHQKSQYTQQLYLSYHVTYLPQSCIMISWIAVPMWNYIIELWNMKSYLSEDIFTCSVLIY